MNFKKTIFLFFKILIFLLKFKKIYFFKFFFKNLKINQKLIIYFKRSNLFFKKNTLFTKKNFKKKILRKKKIKTLRTRYKKKNLLFRKYIFKFKLRKLKKKHLEILRFKYFFLKKLKLNIDFLKNFFFKQSTKKKRLIYFFSKLSKKRTKIISSIINKFLFIILLQSHFFFYIHDLKFFLSKGLIFINGFSTKDHLFLTKQGDRIQLPITTIYYIYFKQNWKFLKFKIKFLIYKRWRLRKYKSKINFRFWFPSFLQQFLFYKVDVPSIYEVDYLTLTLIIIKIEKNILKKNIFLIKIFSALLIKSYSWKQIT